VTARPRVVHVTTTDISLRLLLGPQLRAFTAAGYEVIGASAPGPHVAALTEWGIEHRAVPSLTRSVDPRADLRAPLDLVRLFRELRPDLVHTHNPKPGVFGRVAARLARVPHVVNTVHGLYAVPDDRFTKRAVVYGLERIASACSDAELVQNPEDVTTLRGIGVPARKLHLLGNGIDLTRFDPDRVDPDRIAARRAEMGATADEVVCGVVGRLVWEKGYREVFDAAATLRARGTAVRLVVIGPMEDSKGDAVSAADIAAAEQSGVTFLGMRDDLEDLYAAMDLFVLASHREGFPRAAMEAAAMRLPVVATDIRGCRQVVDPGTTGLLVPVRDPVALADAIADLAADPARRAAMGRAGRAKAIREFDDRRVVDITLDVYDRLLSRTCHGRA